MAALRYRDEHNKVGYLKKPTGSDDYHQILDFLRASHIRYALTNDPIIFDSLVKQFWSTATLRSPELGPPAILATIDETPYTITEDSVRSQLQLADDGGIDDLPIAEIYSGMDNLGYVTEGKLTFYKNKFSPQWRFLVDTILHCLSTKSGSWDQFGSSLAVALICLSDGRKFNWSSYIFKGMVSNIGNAKKFLMYPRFLQTILGIETSFTRQYHVFKLSSKLFAYMKLNFEGQPMQLLVVMLPQDQEGEGVGVAAHAVLPPIPEPIPEPMPKPDQPQEHLSTPPRQQTAGYTSGGAEDLITLTVVSSVVSTLVQKVTSLETELKDTKKLFKDVVGKLVKKVKAMEVKLKTKKRKVVMSDSDQEEGGEQNVDLDALLALANAAVIVDSNIPPCGASSSHIPTDVPTDVPTGVAPVGVSNKGKTPMVEEDITVKERTLKHMEDDRLGEEAAKRLHDEEQAQVDRQIAEVEANASLSKTLLGDDVTEDNFPIMMAALIKRKKQALAEKLAKERMERPMTPVQQRTYMRQFVKNQSSALYSTGWTKAKVESPELEEPSSKQQKSTEATIPSVLDVPQPPVVSLPKSSSTRRKSLGRNRLTKPKSILKELDLDADDKTFIKVVSDEDSTDEAPILWSALAGWEVISTPLGEINALYESDQSTKHFTTLREILHMVDRQDLLKLYGMVVTYYENHLIVGAGLMLWDVSYPLSVKLMERMLKHKLEIDKDVVGNDMTTAEQLIRFIKNQIAAAQGPQKPKTSISDDTFSENSVTTNEKVVSKPTPKEVEPSCVTHVKTPRQRMKNQGTPKVNRTNRNEMMERELGEGYSFIKKKCFICGSLSHLIKNCDFYEKKMAREAELKKQRVFNTGNGVAKPVWNNANRVNHANHFVPRPIQLIAVRQNINYVRPNVNTGRADVNSVRQNVNSVRFNVNTGSFNVNTFRTKQPLPTSNSNSFSSVKPQGTDVKTSAGYNWRNTRPNSNCNSGSNFIQTEHPLKNMEDKGIFDCGCSGHMTGNKDQLDDFEECKGGSVTFGGSKGYITGTGRIKVGNLDFDSLSFVKELGHFNLFSISQICDKQHKVLFTETECLVVSPDFKMPDENQILLKVPRQHNMYSFDMNTPALTKDYACLIAKATSDESKLWYRRLGHINFKNLNKLVKGNLVRGLPSKIENQLNHRVKIIRSDNDTEFKNRDMLEFCGNKGIKQEYSNARTPQQNGVTERINRTLIEAARTMLADLLVPTTFWAEAVSTACYIFNRVRVTKPQNKTPYELLFGYKPIISYIRPFGCHVTILDTLSVLDKFDGKCDEGTSEVTNIAGTLQTPNANTSEEEDKAEELIVVPTTVMHTVAKVGPRKSSTNSKAEEFLTELQNLKTQENEAYSTGISEDTPDILAFRTKLDELSPKLLREVPKNKATSTTSVNSGSGSVNSQHADQDDSDMPELTILTTPKKRIFDEASYDDEGLVYDFKNLPTEVAVSPIPTLRIHNIHPQSQILGDPKSSVQTRSREEPKKISEALKDDSWVEAMQEELLQFRLQQVWILVDLPHGAKVIGTKWVYKNKRDEKGVVVRNKARLVAQDEEVYVSQPPGFVDPDHSKKLSKLYMDYIKLPKLVKQTTDGIFIPQDKYVADMLKKFDLASVKTTITPMETKMALTKDEEADEVDVHLYRSMIGSLMYLTASRPDIMFAVCACSRFHFTPKTSHLNAVKRIFKYLKGKPNLGLWYPRESSFNLEAYSDSDYAGANLDRKFTTGGCQFLRSRLISWQCKKQTIVATSTTEAEYVAAASCCGQVLWIQNQMLDYGFNFINTKIHIDNESTICIVKNPVYHSKTKHIQTRHHFIRDSYEKKLIRVEKIHTDFNVADLLTKAFDGPRFNFLVVNIGMINL
ncbi:synaptobrevin, longin-like domain protein [Tanacetum coccineum]